MLFSAHATQNATRKFKNLAKSILFSHSRRVQVPSSAVFSKALIIQESSKKPVKSRLFKSKNIRQKSNKIRINLAKCNTMQHEMQHETYCLCSFFANKKQGALSSLYFFIQPVYKCIRKLIS